MQDFSLLIHQKQTLIDRFLNYQNEKFFDFYNWDHIFVNSFLFLPLLFFFDFLNISKLQKIFLKMIEFNLNCLSLFILHLNFLSLKLI